jgi:hypothetical protein
MKVVLVLLIAAFSTFGQQPNAAIITPEDFRPIFNAGFRVTQELGKQGLRYTETRRDGVLTVENDRRGVVRASYSMSGILQNECIVNGDRIYERTGQGPWIIRTQAEFKAEQTARAEVLTRARAEKDHETYNRVFAETRKRIFVQAGYQTDSGLTFRAFRINSTMLSFASPGVDNRVITELGPSEHKGKAVRLFRYTADRQNVPYGRGFRKHRLGVEYWFEHKTGAVMKIRTLNEWSSDVETTKEIDVHEWELDPYFEIKVPIGGGGR